ncbi:MAG: hypothetical protein ABI183_10915 [Polyangiaceae bacterium]
MRFRRTWLALAASLLLAPFAHAQDVGKPPPSPNASANPSAANPNPSGQQAGPPTAAAGDATNTTTPASGPAPTMGYAYGGTHKSSDTGAAPRAHSRTHAHHVSGPVATLPGFELLPEGGSRLFVQLTATVQVAEKTVAGGLTYVLKGARILKRNNENALITVHFNTPVSRARLLPAGGDLHFVVDLRQNVKPTWKLVPAKDGATVLQIDFPGGDYLPHDASSDGPPSDASKPGKPAAPDAPKK